VLPGNQTLHMLALVYIYTRVYTRYLDNALLAQYCDQAMFVLLTHAQCIRAVQGSCTVVIADVVNTDQLLGYNQSDMSARLCVSQSKTSTR